LQTYRQSGTTEIGPPRAKLFSIKLAGGRPFRGDRRACSDTKQNRAHVVPLSAPARQLLSEIEQRTGERREFVFPMPICMTTHNAPRSSALAAPS